MNRNHLFEKNTTDITNKSISEDIKTLNNSDM